MAGEVSATGVMLAQNTYTGFAGGRAVGIVGTGGGITVGVYGTNNNSNWYDNVGIFAMPEAGGGIDASTVIEAGFIKGTLDSPSINANLGAGLGGVSAIFDPKTGFSGASVSVGPSWSAVTASITGTKAFTISLGDALRTAREMFMGSSAY